MLLTLNTKKKTLYIGLIMFKYCLRPLTYSSHFMHYDIGTISMIPVLQMNKLGLREVKQFA